MRLAPRPSTAALLHVGSYLAPRAFASVVLSDPVVPPTLDRTLHLLYIAVAVMAVGLVFVAALAFAVYRKNRGENLTPDGSDDSTL